MQPLLSKARSAIRQSVGTVMSPDPPRTGVSISARVIRDASKQLLSALGIGSKPISTFERRRFDWERFSVAPLPCSQDQRNVASQYTLFAFRHFACLFKAWIGCPECLTSGENSNPATMVSAQANLLDPVLSPARFVSSFPLVNIICPVSTEPTESIKIGPPRLLMFSNDDLRSCVFALLISEEHFLKHSSHVHLI